MTIAQAIGQIGIIMLMAPLFGYAIYLGISSMITEYKYAKFRDKVDKTDHQVRYTIYSIIAVVWIVIAGILMMTACLMSSF